MGMRPPFRIINSELQKHWALKKLQFLDAHHTGVVYPHAISLIQSVRDYQITHAMVAERPGAEMLVASLRKDLHNAFLAVSLGMLQTNSPTVLGSTVHLGFVQNRNFGCQDCRCSEQLPGQSLRFDGNFGQDRC
jgi:hypothetical protein